MKRPDATRSLDSRTALKPLPHPRTRAAALPAWARRARRRKVIGRRHRRSASLSASPMAAHSRPSDDGRNRPRAPRCRAHGRTPGVTLRRARMRREGPASVEETHAPHRPQPRTPQDSYCDPPTQVSLPDDADAERFGIGGQLRRYVGSLRLDGRGDRRWPRPSGSPHR